MTTETISWNGEEIPRILTAYQSREGRTVRAKFGGVASYPAEFAVRDQSGLIVKRFDTIESATAYADEFNARQTEERSSAHPRTGEIEEWQAYAQFSDYLDECHPVVKFGELTFMPSAIIRELDWTAYREAFLNYIDFMGIQVRGY